MASRMQIHGYDAECVVKLKLKECVIEVDITDAVSNLLGSDFSVITIDMRLLQDRVFDSHDHVSYLGFQ